MNILTEENQQKAVYKDEKTQKELNTPLSDPAGVGENNEQFLNLIISLINEGKIDLYKPATLINQNLYDQLTEDKKGKVDLEAMNLLSAIREIKGLFDTGNKDTYQMKNLVERVKNTKERLEEEGGDLFII
jgi:predicted HTH domain antitoxin